MRQIIPNLWFDHVAEEAVAYYLGVFKNSRIGRVARYNEAVSAVSGMTAGEVMSIDFKLCGQDFTAINAGGEFKFSPAVSLTVLCETEGELDAIWSKLSAGGQVMMELGEYPFSKKFGFLADKYGVAWQLNLAGEKQRILPSLIFVNQSFGKAESAMRDYVSLFPNSKVVTAERYGKGEAASEGSLKFGLFSLNGQEFIAMDGAGKHAFTFTAALSLMAECETQTEVDRFWSHLTKGGQELPCGWLFDKYGVCWQVAPSLLRDLLNDPDRAKAERATKAMLEMKKIDIEKIKKAHAG